MGKIFSFSLIEKRNLLEAYDKLPKMSQQEAAAKLDVSEATLCSNNEKQSVAGDEDWKQMCTGKAAVTEATLIKWTDNARSCNAP